MNETDPIEPNYYKQYKHEPIEVIEDWKLPFTLGNVVKYISRFRDKNGLEDLKKARYYLDYYIKQTEEK